MFSLPDLPYPDEALEPVISARTLRLHHGKHHRAYVETVNRLLEEADDRPHSLEAVIRSAERDPKLSKLFNNAAQTWNHGFFWEAMWSRPSRPEGDLATAIDAVFGDLAALKSAFVKSGAEHFGSGWVWLLARGDHLTVVATHDAANPVGREGIVPLLVCDLWEHAYYLDHENDRKGFLEAWFDTLPNWTLAASQFDAARGRGPAWAWPAPEPAAGTARPARR